MLEISRLQKHQKNHFRQDHRREMPEVSPYGGSPAGRHLGTKVEEGKVVLWLFKLSSLRFFSLESPDRKDLRKMRESDGVSDKGEGEMQ
jgi:hypothetical protein